MGVEVPTFTAGSSSVASRLAEFTFTSDRATRTRRLVVKFTTGPDTPCCWSASRLSVSAEVKRSGLPPTSVSWRSVPDGENLVVTGTPLVAVKSLATVPSAPLRLPTPHSVSGAAQSTRTQAVAKE